MSVRVGDEHILAVNQVPNIGGYFDCEMRMEIQVKNTCRSAWLNLYNMGKIRSYMTLDQARTVIQAYVTSKLDSNNVLLAGTTSELQTKLQLVQNAAVRLISRSKKRDHVTPLLYNLHWLPIKDRIIFKILLLTYMSLNDAVQSI